VPTQIIARGKDTGEAYKYEVGSDIGSTGDEVLVGRVEMRNVTGLHDKKDDPVDARDDKVEGERSSHVAVLSPYCMTMMAMFAICGGVEGVVHSCNNDKQP
jgi:hypothetical protein